MRIKTKFIKKQTKLSNKITYRKPSKQAKKLDKGTIKPVKVLTQEEIDAIYNK